MASPSAKSSSDQSRSSSENEQELCAGHVYRFDGEHVWKRYYASLHNRTMRFFISETSEKPFSNLELARATVVCRDWADDRASPAPEAEGNSGKFFFRVITPERVWRMYTPTEESADKWVAALEHEIRPLPSRLLAVVSGNAPGPRSTSQNDTNRPTKLENGTTLENEGGDSDAGSSSATHSRTPSSQSSTDSQSRDASPADTIEVAASSSPRYISPPVDEHGAVVPKEADNNHNTTSNSDAKVASSSKPADAANKTPRDTTRNKDPKKTSSNGCCTIM